VVSTHDGRRPKGFPWVKVAGYLPQVWIDNLLINRPGIVP
jgi:hypothetical protein